MEGKEGLEARLKELSVILVQLKDAYAEHYAHEDFEKFAEKGGKVIYRDDYYKDEKHENTVAEVIIAKNRHGSLDKVKLGWIGQYTKFTNLA